MPLFDTHVHYNLSPLLEQWQSHWQKAQAQGVSKSVVVGADLENSKVAVEIAKQDASLYACVGLHPDICDQTQVNFDQWLANQVEQLETLIKENKSTVIALGEMGLDYYWLEAATRSQKISQQKELFRLQLKLALKYSLPIVLHIRDQQPTEGSSAYDDVLAILKTDYFEQIPLANRHFILHCASGPLSFIKDCVDEGAYVGFDGNLTYPKADHLREIFKLTPESKRLLETDAPYLPPQSFRGKTCEPWMVSLTAQFMKDELASDPEQLSENAFLAFNLTENDRS